MIPIHISIMVLVVISVLTISVHTICAFTRTGCLSTLARLSVIQLLGIT